MIELQDLYRFLGGVNNDLEPMSLAYRWSEGIWNFPGHPPTCLEKAKLGSSIITTSNNNSLPPASTYQQTILYTMLPSDATRADAK